MKKKPNKETLKQALFVALLIGTLFSVTNLSYGFSIRSQNVQSMAIYGEASGFGIGLQPNQLVFNVTNPSVISKMISSVEFSAERDCSALAARANATVYIKFKDGSIEVYNLMGLWSHIYKAGLYGTCYFVSEAGQTLFENNAQ